MPPWRIFKACSLLSALGGGLAGIAFPAVAGPQTLSDREAREQIHLAQIPSPYKLSNAVRAGRIRYYVHLDGNTGWNWPATGEQKVEIEGARFRITICTTCGDETPSGDRPSLARYLAPNRHVDSDAANVRAFAGANATSIHMNGKRVHRQMKRLVTAVQRRLSAGLDFTRYASASEALESGSGDCTEYAVLLAAAARARGIPTRLVYGIAYASRFTGRSHTFSPHVWVQAWDGLRWTSYDAGLGQFDSGHIALFIDDGSGDRLQDVTQAIRRLHIDAAEGVRIRPAKSVSAKPAVR
jgi:hypothetical protein